MYVSKQKQTYKILSFFTCLLNMLRVLVKLQPLNLPMNRLELIILHLILVLLHAEAQTIGSNFSSSDGTNNYQPSLVVVIGALSAMFVLTLLILAYAKFCHKEPVRRNSLQNRTGRISASNRFSGIDKTVVESLPFFRFSSLKGSKDGLECAVCLSKFEEIEVLRLLPKCKHAFHLDCIDHWLEKHSSCPLCRHKVSSEDLKLITNSNSMRFLWNNQSELRDQESNNMELFVQREESHGGSSRFSIGGSFRKIHEKGHHKEEELLIQQETEADEKAFHKHNHKIIASDFTFNNRWSNLSSSDLIFLNSEMLNDMSSGRFASMDWNIDMSSAGNAAENEEIMKIKDEMEMKKPFESKVGRISTSNGRASTSSHASRSMMNSGDQRSVSEITSFSRHGDFGVKNRIRESSLFENNVKEERIRSVWMPIARRTVQWFANREKRSQLSENPLTGP